MKSPLAGLQKTLGYNFTDADLLRRALTHSSARAKGAVDDNQRLEFLGDRVLGLVMAELVCELYPEASEGELARVFNRLVRRDACAEVAVRWGLGDHLILSGGEADSGGRAKANILADACEAVLGALYLDGGLQVARDLVRGSWSETAAATGKGHRDPKTALQEWAQSHQLGLPVYAEIERAGPDHAPSFTAEVRIPGLSPASGSGTSKRLAEQAAARTMIEREGIAELARE